IGAVVKPLEPITQEQIDNTPILDEAGLLITRKQLVANGKAYSWGDLGIVRIETRLGFHHLMVSAKGATDMVMAFQTRDNGLLGQMRAAINRVAEIRGAQRQI